MSATTFSENRMALRGVPPEDGQDAAEGTDVTGRISYTASLLIQGAHRFFTLSMPSDVLAESCMVEPRYQNPADSLIPSFRAGKFRDEHAGL
jgi:hypothetical protein